MSRLDQNPESAPPISDGEFSVIEQPLPETLPEAHQEITRLREEARHDELTALPNLRYFREELDRRTSAAERAGTSVAILMIDLPGLKKVNNVLGHDIGDAALRSFSRILEANCRGADLVARVGGDEVAVLLEGERIGPFLNRLDQELQQPHPNLPGPTKYYLGFGLYEGAGVRDASEIERKRAAAYAEAQQNLSEDKRRQKGADSVA